MTRLLGLRRGFDDVRQPHRVSALGDGFTRPGLPTHYRVRSAGDAGYGVLRPQRNGAAVKGQQPGVTGAPISVLRDTSVLRASLTRGVSLKR